MVLDLGTLDFLKEIEKEGRKDEKQFKLKTDFVFNGEGNTLDSIIYNREKEIINYKRTIDLWQFKESGEAVDILIKNKDKKIALVSDYDVDGITGNLVLTTYLVYLGYKVHSIIPERKNGYGITNMLVDEAIENDCEIIITIDNGTGARDPIEYAKEKGFIVIVTDHHMADEDTISNPDVLLNYNMFTDQYPISGCGAAYTLGMLLAEKLGKTNKDLEKELLGLVSVSIIADVCPLYGVNREIVEKNLGNIRETKNKALKSLVDSVCGDGYYPEIGFGLAPIINSMGRYNRAGEMFRYFQMLNQSQIDGKLKEILKFNNFRKKEVDKLLNIAEKQVNPFELFNLIILEEDAAPGLLGLVAGRIASSTNKLTLVVRKNGEGYANGSGRTGSIPIVTTVNNCKGDLDTWAAGHDAACGFGIKLDDVEEFKNVMNKYIEEQDIEESQYVDCILPEPDCYTLKEIKRQEEILWGQGYDFPCFASKGLKLIGKERIKEGSKHWRFFVRDKNGKEYSFIFFGGETFLEEIQEGEKVDILYTVGINRWRGREEIQYSAYNLRKR